MLKTSIVHQIEATAKAFPHRNAICARGKHYTYKQLFALVTSIKHRLQQQGYTEERLIGVLIGDDVMTYAAILAILANGSAYVPINNKNPRDRNAEIIAESSLRVILSTHPHHRSIDGINAVLENDVHIVSVSDIQGVEGDWQLPDTSPGDLAYLFFTSGSTGKPKGVPIYHRNLNGFMSVVLDPAQYNFCEEDKFLQMFELTFDLSVMSFFTPLAVGACCYIVPDDGVAYLNIVDILDRYEITVALMVPSILAYIERFFDEMILDSLRFSLFCGEALPQRLVEGWSKCVPNARIQNVYGPTEATIYCLIYEWKEEVAATEAVNGVVAIGRPVSAMHTLIVNKHLEPLPAGAKGELCLYGVQVTDHYWENEKQTQQAFFNIKDEHLTHKAYRTGDICYINENGNYIYCGRADSQVKVDGHRVELGEIEHHAREFSGKSLVAVITTTQPEGTVILNLFLEKCNVSTEALIEYLRGKLPPYMVPRSIHLVDKMPLNLNGKIDRLALKKLIV